MKSQGKKILKIFMLLAVCAGMLLSSQGPANAYSISATLTADNHYGLYYGAYNGSSLTFVGRNETTSVGSPGTHNWSLPETWTPNANMHLFVVAWDNESVQAWIGQFTLPNTTLYSNTTNWESMQASGLNPGIGGNVPPLATLKTDIAGGSWGVPGATADYGTSPWGSIPGISSSADFIWHDTFNSTATSDAHYVIFRSKDAIVPVPSALLLIGAGMVRLVAYGRRQRMASKSIG